MKHSTPPRRVATVALAAALASTSVLSLAPSAALAVPAGGYGDLVEQVAPSVVYIEVSSHLSPEAFRKSLPREMQRRLEQSPKDDNEGIPMQGVGSGFVISADGEIVTNAHVVDGADSVSVRMADGRRFEARVIGSDPLTDVALLKIEGNQTLPAVNFGDSDTMRVGDEVVAVGNPFGLGGTVTSGIVSAMSRNINAGPFDEFIQTDAAINRGNSGGPLFNNAGEVIGMNTAIFSPDGGSVGIGFAVPSDLVQQIVADLSDDGEITRGWLGVQIKPMSDQIASVLGYDTPKGAVVAAVMQDSPAASAGLVKGDIILSIDGTEISELRDLTRAVAKTAPETEASVVVWHKGEQVTRSVTIGTLAPQET